MAATFDRDTFAALALGSDGTDPRPNGNHLRWAFAGTRPFPPGGFDVYRRATPQGERRCLALTRDLTGQTFRGRFELGGFTFDAPEPVRVIERFPPPTEPELLLPNVKGLAVTLPRPARSVEITLFQTHHADVRAFAGPALVGRVSSRQQGAVHRLELAADGIDRLEFDAAETTVLKLCEVEIEDHLPEPPERDGWERLAGPLALPADFAEGRPRLTADPAPVRRAHEAWMGDAIDVLLAPGDPRPGPERGWRFIDGQDDPVGAGVDAAGRATFEVTPQRLLLLAAMDPEFARFLGLGLVDGTALAGRPYDYLIISRWADGDWLAVCHGVTRRPAPPLAPPARLTSATLRVGGEGPGRSGLAVGLTWELPLAAAGRLLSGAAVSYDVQGVRPAEADAVAPDPATVSFPPDDEVRNPEGRAVVSRDRDGRYPEHFFLDFHLPDGWYAHRVRGYDLFGRESRWTAPVLTRLLDTVPPPSPLGLLEGGQLLPIRARYLDPAADDLTAEEIGLLAGGGPLTVVEWDWLEGQAEAAPDAAEFRVYFRLVVVTAEVTVASVGALSADAVVVTLAAAPPLDGTGGELRVRGRPFLVLAQSGAVLTARPWRVAGADGAVALVTPEVGRGHLTPAVSAPRTWERRLHVEPVDANLPARRYRALIRGPLLVPTPASPIATGWIGVTAADGRRYFADDPGWAGPLAGRPGNESPILTRAEIRAVDRSPPGPGPVPAGPRFATRADYHGRSRYRLTWAAAAPATYHVYRAAESSVAATDLRARRQRTGHYAANGPFDDDPGFDAFLAAEFPGLAAADLLAASLTRPALAAWAAWAARFYAAGQLSDNDLQRMADRAGNEAAFAQVTGEAITGGSFDDTVDGRVAGRYLYRTRAVHPNGRRGLLSPTAAPVHLHDVMPPAAPVIARLEVADRSILVAWGAGREPDLSHYEVYRADQAGPPDPRRMSRVGVDVAAGGRCEVVDRGVQPGREYSYAVVAVDAAGNASAPSGLRRARAIALTPPAAPALRAERTAAGSVRVVWATPEEGARTLLERRLAGAAGWEALTGWLDPTARQFDDTRTPVGVGLEYRATLLDAAGNISEPAEMAVPV